LRPIVLAANQPPERFYLGGERIAAFRGVPASGDRTPEDWIASTTTLAGEATIGLTVLPGGRTLREAVAADPAGWLGPDHLARHGADTRLLVKLLHAGERLPVHAHPDGAFAATHLGRAHGKAEAWYILDGGRVHLGLRREVAPEHLARLVAEQRVDELLDLLHGVDVAPGDVVYVPPGVPHAIGAGIFLAELQEPEDLSILLEWRDFAIDGTRDGHLGLGFDRALRAVDRRALTPDRLRDLIRPAGTGRSVLPGAADPYFRLEHRRIDGPTVVERGFAVLVAIDGDLVLDERAIPAGTTVVAPWAAGDLVLRGHGRVLVCRPPA
jgi:mannose-6-phosphate isomerase